MKKIGLCLSGGGARGAYQIGAVKALQDLGLFDQITYFSGTSIGAVNSTLLATNNIDQVTDLWFNIPLESLKSGENIIKKLTKEKLQAIDKGIYSMDTLEEILLKHVKYEQLKNKEIFITVSEIDNIENGLYDLVKSTYKHYFKKDEKVLYISLKDLPENEVYKSIIASCSIPIVFPAVEHNNKRYYDGGVFDNIPVRPLIEAGCEEIIIIHLVHTILFKTNKYPNVVFHQIKHRRSLGNILNFNSDNSKKLYDYGYQDTMNYFNKKYKEGSK